MKSSKTVPCPGCSGMGQTSYFGGVSRFLLSHEECPECNGLGFLPAAPESSLSAKQLGTDCSLSPREADKFLRELAHALTMALLQGEEIRLRGFGSFFLSAAKNGKKKVIFKPGSALQQV